MELIAAGPDDAERIALLHAESWRVHYRGFYRDAYLDGPVVEDRLATWRQRFESPAENQFVLLATEGDALRGFVCAYGAHEEEWGTLVDNLHVRSAQQGKGIGRMLLLAAMAWSLEQDPHARVHLWVLEGNVRARGFYGRMGGAPQETRVSVAAGGGNIVGVRYVWEPTLIQNLLSRS